MIAKAEIKHVRIAPPKIRQVIALLRGRDVTSAQATLKALNKRPREFISKLLDSAVANAKVKGFGVEQLYISKIICNTGPSWKRFKAAAFGRAAPILRRTAHLKLELDVK
ncbi:MAG: 50S ribosomal protein L22 [Candidatus Omnitrophica bacterium]|nr:50S ribosomal protein L22 [Candidatus Omnitrophota bacterium]MDD4940444.1 50S ribosomal protein L22 [Candidatus Omnitrophota bacterium]MDD5774586.1 50S ribosomal protein L22 [Candidatus Omnitrophota bacterium]HNQ51386.1 50S ribosomal protein L22 [Candidatus Omnitrophota bacterium]HQO38052.1 50S ribosomal protein L22 [Candidatus Omnitrophota bacterium]